MAFKNNGQEKGSIAYLQQQSNSARSFLLITVILSAVNCVLLFTEFDRFFLYSAWFPYWQLDLNVLGLGGELAIVWAVLSVGALLVCWIMWNKNKLFSMVAAALMAADTVYLVITMSDWKGILNEDGISTMILNLIFHIIVVVFMVIGYVHLGKLEKARAAAQAAAPQPAQTEFKGPEF